MAFQIRYQPLCLVALRHGFHLNEGTTEFDDLPDDRRQRMLRGFDIFDDLRLLVPPDTQRTLAGLDMVVRTIPTGVIVAQSVEEPAPGIFVPKRLPQRPFRLRFALRAAGSAFWNYTNLDRPSRALYYLSNRAGLAGGTFPYLSAPAQVFSAGTLYRAGEVVRKGPGAVVSYLAVRTGAHASPTPADANWHRLASRNYVSGTDRATLHPPVFSFRFPASTVKEAAFALVDLDGVSHAMGNATAPDGDTLTAFELDARGLPAGLYRMQVTGLDTGDNPYAHSEAVYLDALLPSEDVFALIELFHVPGEALGPFRFYDEVAGHRLLQPEFFVLLLNRHTFWRYRFRVPPAPGTDLGDLEEVDGHLVTKEVMPLTRGFEEVSFDGGKLLPNPSDARISPESDRMYSDVHVHINP
jgi:hypothetical protein